MLAIRSKGEEHSGSHEDQFLARYRFLFFRCLSLTRERDAAKDLLHDAYVQFVVNRPDLDSINNLNSYLTRLVRNLYASQMRMARSQKKNHIPIEDFDSAEMALRNNKDFSAQLQAQQELIWISRYVFIRRENSREASTLILRYFHGYYAWEIARILNATEIVVHSLLKRARNDVRESVRTSEAPRRLFAGLPKYMMGLRAGVPTTDFLKALREALLRPANGHCIPRNELDSLSFLSRELNCAHLAHIVHCAYCLDRVSRLKGLAPLSERHSVDAADGEKRGRKGGGNGEPPEPPLATRISRGLASQVEDTFQHRPETLQVSINGIVIACQRVCSAVSELDLAVAIGEAIDFIEVVSEQGIRLLFMNVEPPSPGPSEQIQRVCLSGERSLATVLSFADELPTLKIRYEDPSFEAIMSAERFPAVILGPVLLPRFGPHTEQDDKTTNARDAALRWLRQGLQHIGQWPKCARLRASRLAAASVALILVLALVIHQMRPEIVSASELLERSSRSDQAGSENPAFVQHRSLILDEFDYPSMHLVSHRRIEVWQSAQKRVRLRRLFDDENHVIAEERIEAENAPRIFSTVPEKPKEKITFDENRLEGNNVWLLDLSSTSFASLIPHVEVARVDRTEISYVICYDGNIPPLLPPQTTEPALLTGRLTLKNDTLHPIREELVVRESGRTREFQISESAVELLPVGSVDPKVFEPILAENMAKMDLSKAPVKPTLGGTRLSGETLANLQIEALYRLNQIGPELVNEIRVAQTGDGHVEVQGTVDSEERKSEVLSALRPIVSNPLLTTNIQTISEALVLQLKEHPEPSTAREVQTTKGDIPVAAELSRYFKEQWDEQSHITAVSMLQDWVANRIRMYSGDVVGESYRAYLHALALRDLARQLSSAQIALLDKPHRSEWDALVRSHAQAICLETRAVRQELQPIFFGGQGQQESSTLADMPAESLSVDTRRISEIVFAWASVNDEIVVSAFTVSNEPQTKAVSNIRRLEQSLKRLEDLASKLAASRE